MMDPQLIWTAGLGLYVIGVLFATRWPYERMVSGGMTPIRATYYTRKIVHVFAGGIPSLLVPIVFADFWYPMAGGIILGLLAHLAHATGRRLHWFQVSENRNDVTFAVMWWVSLSILWWLLDDPWLAILPALFMSFGDGVTGVVRNAVIRRRSKHPIGNAFMLLVCLPLGVVLAGQASPPIPLWGALAAVIATIVERYELGPLDDNVLIAVSSVAILLIGSSLGPLAPGLMF